MVAMQATFKTKQMNPPKSKCSFYSLFRQMLLSRDQTDISPIQSMQYLQNHTELLLCQSSES